MEMVNWKYCKKFMLNGTLEHWVPLAEVETELAHKEMQINNVLAEVHRLEAEVIKWRHGCSRCKHVAEKCKTRYYPCDQYETQDPTCGECHHANPHEDTGDNDDIVCMHLKIRARQRPRRTKACKYFDS